jgi:hypothetical protein
MGGSAEAAFFRPFNGKDSIDNYLGREAGVGKTIRGITSDFNTA